MHLSLRLAQVLTLTVLGPTTAAIAEETSQMPSPTEASPGEPAAPAEPGVAPAPAEPAGPAEPGAASAAGEPGMSPAPAEPDAASAEEPAVASAAAAKPADLAHYGLALRWRWVTVPGWFLGLFAERNVALSTFNCFGLEGYWRKPDKENRNRTWEIVVSVGYQNMSPPDGFWLGRGKELTQDTDLVQAKGLGLITFDAAYVLRQYFSPYFGIHYGAGLGLGIVRGKVMRTSAVCDPVTGQCHVEISQTSPRVVQCGHAGEAACTEQDLLDSETVKDYGPYAAHRFQETSVPSAVPIINLLFGLDFPIPDAKGLEFRIEGGFYDAFFVGASAGYVF
ncbi:MAG: hypothetical protein JXP73_03870 [Deltaproteobacteria bacterium]|nr:hypothetical protein [Deltaproteobacteria bacterium]